MASPGGRAGATPFFGGGQLAAFIPNCENGGRKGSRKSKYFIETSSGRGGRRGKVLEFAEPTVFPRRGPHDSSLVSNA